MCAQCTMLTVICVPHSFAGAVTCFFYNQRRHIRESAEENRENKAEQYKKVLKRSRQRRVSMHALWEKSQKCMGIEMSHSKCSHHNVIEYDRSSTDEPQKFVQRRRKCGIICGLVTWAKNLMNMAHWWYTSPVIDQLVSSNELVPTTCNWLYNIIFLVCNEVEWSHASLLQI